jgi:hypothetical protein
MITVIGQVCGIEGLVQTVDRAGTPDPYTLPAASYLTKQSARLPLRIDHDKTWQVGTVGHLERSRSSGLMLVGTIPDDALGELLADGPWFLSDSVITAPDGVMRRRDGYLVEVSLVRRTANLNTRPVCWAVGDIAANSCGRPPMPLLWHDTWKRAEASMGQHRYRQAPDHLSIVDVDGVKDQAVLEAVGHRRSEPTVKDESRAGCVTLNGTRLNAQQSDLVLDLLEFG